MSFYLGIGANNSYICVLIMITMYRHYSPRMKFADLISSDAALLSVVHRLRIPFGFGDATVAEICRMHGISQDLFMVLAKTYSDPEYDPSSEIGKLGKDDLPVIVDFLKASHGHYVNVSFPRLHSGIHKLLEGCDKSTEEIMNRFFDDYEREELNHFSYEEQYVFPYVESLLNGGSDSADLSSCEGQFQENHQNIGSHLTDIKNLVIKYISSPQASEVQMDVLEQIFRIETDTIRHASIEEKILLPLVEKMQERNEIG